MMTLEQDSHKANFAPQVGTVVDTYLISMGVHGRNSSLFILATQYRATSSKDGNKNLRRRIPSVTKSSYKIVLKDTRTRDMAKPI
jgi:hypothetical protein